jgi:hypothetical protein
MAGLVLCIVQVMVLCIVQMHLLDSEAKVESLNVTQQACMEMLQVFTTKVGYSRYVSRFVIQTKLRIDPVGKGRLQSSIYFWEQLQSAPTTVS